MPGDQRNTRIQETFGAPTNPPPADLTALRQALRERVFRGWPEDPGPLGLREVAAEEHGEVRLRVFEFSSQPHVPLWLFVAERLGSIPNTVRFNLLDDTAWARWRMEQRPRFDRVLARFGSGTNAVGPSGVQTSGNDPAADERMVWFSPRGEGPHAWSGDTRKQVQLRRRFQLLGQTVDGMRVWDLRRALQAVRQLGGDTEVQVAASGRLSVLAAVAAVFEDRPPALLLSDQPKNLNGEPDLLNVTRVADPASILEILGQHTRLTLGP